MTALNEKDKNNTANNLFILCSKGSQKNLFFEGCLGQVVITQGDVSGFIFTRSLS